MFKLYTCAKLLLSTNDLETYNLNYVIPMTYLFKSTLLLYFLLKIVIIYT